LLKDNTDAAMLETIDGNKEIPNEVMIEMIREPRNYAYRMDHDTGFAPHTNYEICSLCGCKTTTIEQWARTGSWVIGIGGNRTGKPDHLIYMMKVTEILPLMDFRLRFKRKSKYLNYIRDEDAPVLISQKFWYFGDNALQIKSVPASIRRGTQGCHRISDSDISRLEKTVLGLGFNPGIYGSPNNVATSVCSSCQPVL